MNDKQLLVRIDERVHALSLSHEELKTDVKEVKEHLFHGARKIGWLKLNVRMLWSTLAIIAGGIAYLFKKLIG